MRNVSVQEFEEHPADFFAEVEAGTRLTIVRGGKAIATVAPAETKTQGLESREAARAALLALMDRGIDLGGKPFTYEERHGE